MRRDRSLEPELTDAQIEAIVTEAIAADAADARADAAPPSSGIVWWRAQMRARQEAAQLADKPIAIVHALAIACGTGIALSLLGIVLAGVRGFGAWIRRGYDTAAALLPAISSFDLSSPWITVSMTAMLVCVVIVSIAAFFVLADE